MQGEDKNPAKVPHEVWYSFSNFVPWADCTAEQIKDDAQDFICDGDA